MKPSYGRVSRYGLIAYGSSLDQIGPITKTVTDAALLLELIAGADPRDSTTMPVNAPDFSAALTGEIEGMRIGIPEEYFVEGIQPEVEDAVRSAIDHFASLGAEIVPIGLPNTELALPVYYLIVTAEASANLSRYDGIRFGLSVDGDSIFDHFRQTRGAGFGPEVKRRIMLGTYALSAGYYDAYYLKAQQVRTLIKQDFDQRFCGCRCNSFAYLAHHGVSHRREGGRSACNDFDRHFHDQRQSGRPVRDQRPLRIRRRRFAHRPAAARPIYG